MKRGATAGAEACTGAGGGSASCTGLPEGAEEGVKGVHKLTPSSQHGLELLLPWGGYLVVLAWPVTCDVPPAAYQPLAFQPVEEGIEGAVLEYETVGRSLTDALGYGIAEGGSLGLDDGQD